MTGCPCIYLVGFMCSGKSSTGKLLGDALGRPWLDLDLVIELRTGQSIAAIFEVRGEDGFRELEAECLAQVSEMGETIVSTGGGTVLREGNVNLMRSTGAVIHLSVDAADVLARLGEDRTRPLLAGSDPEAKILRLMAERAPVYERAAHASVSTSGRSPREVCAEVVATLSALDFTCMRGAKADVR